MKQVRRPTAARPTTPPPAHVELVLERARTTLIRGVGQLLALHNELLAERWALDGFKERPRDRRKVR